MASFGVHSLLCALLLIGPTLLRSKDVVDSSPILDFVAFQTTYDDAKGGGDAKAEPVGAELPTPLPSTPKVVEPKPIPVPAKDPEPEIKPVVKPTKSVHPKEPAVKQPVNPDALEQIEKPIRKPDVNTTLVTRKPSPTDKKLQAAKEAANEAKRIAEANRRIADRFTQVANNLSTGLSEGTTIKLKGPGGGGIPYANFFDAVRSIYEKAWVLPSGVTDDQASTTATVLIARNGEVVNARITKLSHNSEVDRSVQAALERVKWAAPLPDSEVKDQREVTINFNVKAKKASG